MSLELKKKNKEFPNTKFIFRSNWWNKRKCKYNE
jgi:hypothetical protein